jgi:lipoprotein NlpI
MARLGLGDVEGAFADLNRAVALDPRNRFVFSSRARAKRDTGDFAGAIEDFGRAIRLDPDSGFLWRQRANTQFAAGEFRAAITDLERAMQLATEVEPYERFWDFVFRVRIGEPAGRDAIEAIARNNKDPWIRSLAGFLNGEIDEARLFAIADEASGRKQAEQQCEAYCYAAILRVARGESGARELFEKCLALGITDFYEHTFAMGELARIDQP